MLLLRRAHCWMQIHGPGLWCRISMAGCWASSPPGTACLHHPGRANSPFSLTESDSSYTVSCGTPVLRQGQHRATNSSQQCLGKGAPGVPTAASSLAGPCQLAEHPPVLSETVAAPVKQKASFKIKDAKCHLHPRTKGKQEEAGRAGTQGEVPWWGDGGAPAGLGC